MIFSNSLCSFVNDNVNKIDEETSGKIYLLFEQNDIPLRLGNIDNDNKLITYNNVKYTQLDFIDTVFNLEEKSKIIHFNEEEKNILEHIKDQIILDNKIEENNNIEIESKVNNTKIFEAINLHHNEESNTRWNNLNLIDKSKLCLHLTNVLNLTNEQSINLIKNNPSIIETQESDKVLKTKSKGFDESNEKAFAIAYKHLLEPAKFICEYYFDNNNKRTFYTNDIDENIEFFRESFESLKTLKQISIISNDASKCLIGEITKTHAHDYQLDSHFGLMTPQLFSQIYNENKTKDSEIINDETSKIILDFLKENNQNIYVIKNNEKNIMFYNKKTENNENVNIGIESFENILETAFYFSQINKKDNMSENKLGNSEISAICKKCLSNYRGEFNPLYKTYEKMIDDYNKQKEFLSINHNRFSDNYKKITERNENFKNTNLKIEKLISNFSDEQLKVFLNLIENEAKKIHNLNLLNVKQNNGGYKK